MLVLPCFRSPKIASRKASASNEVSRPLTSTRDAASACRMITEKLKRAFLALGWPYFTVWPQEGKRLPSFRRSSLRYRLLPHHDSQASPPVLNQAHADYFHFWLKVAQQHIRAGMKSQRRCHQIN